MDNADLLRAIVPVLIAIVPVLLLLFQLRQQNRIERKRVEVEYLRRALEVLELPVAAFYEIESRCNRVALQVRSGAAIDLLSELSADPYNSKLDRFHNALLVAHSFAREAGASDLRAALEGAMETAEACRPLAMAATTRACRGEVVEAALTSEPPAEIAAAIVARVGASRALVARIHQLYG